MIKKSTETIIVQIIGKTCPYTIFSNIPDLFYPYYPYLLMHFSSFLYISLLLLFAECREYEKQVGVKRGMITILRRATSSNHDIEPSDRQFFTTARVM